MNAFDYFFEHTGTLDKPFLLGPRETETYINLHSRCLRLASYLSENYDYGTNILLLAPNSLFFITAYLAVLKSGNIVIPLNPEIEQHNLDFIQEKCQSRLVIATAQLASKLNFNGATVINEKSIQELTETHSINPGLKEATADEQLAEIIFTSAPREPKE
jgi:acyl-CoA synthetase (AMP-forming)/AMP-acid ligase II